MSNEADTLIDKISNRQKALDLSESSEKSSRDPNGFINTAKSAIYEMVAMFMFINIVYFCQGDLNKFVFGMWVILVLFEQFSGAHVNPAITFGFYIYEGKFFNGLLKLIIYWILHFTGALLGTCITREFFSEPIFIGIPTNHTSIQIMFSEFFFTGTYVFVTLSVHSNITRPSKSLGMNSAIIVAWFYMIVNAGISISGACYNPAILIILNEFAKISNENKDPHLITIMVFSQLLGAIVFALIFKYCFENFLKKRNETK
jgi:glycerol uptake facilitator-like aquaporin